MSKTIKQQVILEILKSRPKSRDDLSMANRRAAKKYKINLLSSAEIVKGYQALVKAGKFKIDNNLEKVIRKRAIRTMSGIAPVAVLTKPFGCPGKCAYCPTEKDVPQSYLSNEPAVMRAIRCNYDPYVQVQDRLRALINNGHNPTKIELIVIGGTWSALPKKYKLFYIANCFKAANDFSKRITNYKLQITKKVKISNTVKDLEKIIAKEQKRNEKAKYKIIGLTLETRPDYINEKELLEMRELGCTRVELGVQAVDDKILKLNKRGHEVKEIVAATKLLKDYGFKVTYHLMPGLPGSSAAKDFKMFKQLFSDERFQPDQIKFYPTVVTKGSLLYRWWKQGKYKPYSDKVLQNLIVKCKAAVPQYVRIIRLIRDIPGESIEAGNMITNLRQIMRDQGVKCNCIRCREARSQQLTINNLQLTIIKYKASSGVEYFLQFESNDGKILYGFCRLRTSDCGLQMSDINNKKKFFENTALIRELHVYGELVSVGSKKRVQHAGLGKKLLQEAEKIAKANGHEKISVISGIGVRDYYRKNGYRLENTYMVKKLT